jgi:type IV secretory pathway TrbD component
MLFVTSTTLTAGSLIINTQIARGDTVGYVNAGLAVFVIACVCTVMLWAIARWLSVWLGKAAPRL